MEKLPEAMGFIKNNNYKLVELDKEHLVCEAEITETSLNPYNICHGGFIFGLCDTAAGVLSRVSGKKAYTSSSTINYVRPCAGNKIICKCEPIKVGKTIGVYESRIYDEEDRLCAVATVNYCFFE